MDKRGHLRTQPSLRLTPRPGWRWRTPPTPPLAALEPSASLLSHEQTPRAVLTRLEPTRLAGARGPSGPVAGTGKSAGDPLGLQIGALGPTLGPILEPILEPRPFELVASIRVAGKQPGPASPQPAETG